MEKEKDLYAILEVGYTDTAERIKQSYHYLAKIYHPDINPKTANLFKEINAAYEILGNPEKRKLYDLEHNIGSQRILDRIKVTVSYDPSLALNVDQHLEDIYKRLNDKNLSLEEITQIMSEQLGIFNTITNHLFTDYIKTHRDEDKYNNLPKDEKATDECPFNWFDESTYYMKADQQPIFEILYNLSEYRFENAISATWKRNLFSIVGTTLIYFVSLFYIIRNKIFKKYIPTKEIQKKKYKTKIYKYIIGLQVKNKLLQTFGIFIGLTIFSCIHAIFDILYILYWLFDKILKYFLLPIAVILKGIILGMLLRFLGIRK